MKKHLELKIAGRVQGVFFRMSARKRAEELGLAGYAQNLPDGSVLIEAEGEEESLGEFLEWCRRGPTRARVQRCDHEIDDDLKDFTSFGVK